jgi:[phosphatase 2A protein]-leucine-carboxy methyltransferase
MLCQAHTILGTYVRTTAIDQLVTAFLTSNKGRAAQVISLGAGTDTRYWRLRDKGHHRNVLYHEIDFPWVSKNKLAAIRASRVLSPPNSSFFVLHNVKPEFDAEKVRWGFFRDGLQKREGYLFHPIDLRKMPASIDNLLTDVPTLLLSECCLCYMSPDEAQSVISFFSNLIPDLGIVIYEPTNPYSEFGQVMIKNLAVRGLSMQTIHKYPTLQSQLARLKDAGFEHGQNGADMLWLWQNWVDEREKDRIVTLELMDELEEWQLLAEHYLITWGWRESGTNSGQFRVWRESCPGKVPYPELPKTEVQQANVELEENTDVEIQDF